MKPSIFNWKADGVTDLGLIAQEVMPLVPEVVSEMGKGGMLGINYPGLIPVLVRAIQELHLRLEKVHI